jgi:RND family efflux transporter MFP subunit
MSPLKKILNLLLAPLILAVAIALVALLIHLKKDPPARKPPKARARVEIVLSSPADATPTIRSYGNVRTFYEARIASLVAGEVIKVSDSFQPGLAVAKDQFLVQIDPADYRAAVADRESMLATNEQVLAEEEARSQLAREDWLASGRDLASAPDFTLRKPQLAAAQAKVASANAALDKARLDLERTDVRAPFDAIVGARTTSPGNVVNSGTELGTLIGRDKLEVRLPLTPEQSDLLDLPLAFSNSETTAPLEATLTTPTRPGLSWTARITRTEAGVDARNQVSWVIAEIDKPFANPEEFLPVGAFVNASLAGREIPGVHRLPEAALIEDSYIWILTPENQLARQPVERVFSNNGDFLAKIRDPLAPLPLKVVTRPLASFQPGQTVREGREAPPGPPAEKPPHPKKRPKN